MARLRGHSGLTNRGLIIGTTAPSSAALGQRWFKSDTGVTYQYTNDGASSFWLDVSSGGIGVNAAKGIDYAGTGNPTMTSNFAGLAVGSVYYNIATGDHFVCTDATTNSNDWIGNFIGNGGNLINEYTYNSVTYRVHKFTEDGNFVLDKVTNIDIMLIGGGGTCGAGDANGGGGGGAGELFWTTKSNCAKGVYAIKVGLGGSSSGAVTDSYGNIGQRIIRKGSPSIFDWNGTTPIRVYGGGEGAGYTNSAPTGTGGCGGGHGRDDNTTDNAAAKKYNGGGHANVGGYVNISSYGAGGGGGGTGAVGRNSTVAGGTASPNFGDADDYHTTPGGGIGNSTFIGSSAAETTAFLLGARAGTDSSNVATVYNSSGTLYIGAGGSGSVYKTNDTTTARGIKTGAAGGGGGFHLGDGVSGTVGQANTGSGGGGGRTNVWTAGGSGLVIVRYVVS